MGEITVSKSFNYRKKIKQFMTVGLMTFVITSGYSAGEVLSINFGADRSTTSGTDLIGVEPVEADKWLNTAEHGDTGTNPTTPISITLKDQNDNTALYASTTVALSSRGGSWNAGNTDNATSKMLYGYLDNGGAGEAGVKVSNLPYTEYSVILYFNTDTANSAWQVMNVNGTNYTMASESAEFAVEYTGTLDNSAKWGHSNTKTAIDVGVNTMVIHGLTASELVIRSAHAAAGAPIPGTTTARSCMSGIQIVEGAYVGTAQTFTSSATTQTLTYAAQGSTRAIAGVEVVIDGTETPFDLTAMTVSTAGLTNVDNLKIYSTGTSSTFATNNLIHTIADPTAAQYIITTFDDGAQTLSTGTNYFWIAYDIKSDAVKGATVNANCSQITIDKTSGVTPENKTPTAHTGSGLTITGPANEIQFTGATSTGETDYNWDSAGNWLSPYVDLTGTYPHKGGSGPYGYTAVVDGDGSTIDVRTQDLEGWALTLDITDANLYIDTLRKIQHGSAIWSQNVTQRINTGGKLIIKNIPAGRHFEPCFDVTPEDGVVIEGTLDVGGKVNPHYRLNTVGSVAYETVVDNLTHNLTFSVNDLGTGTFTKVVTRQLISWADTTTGTQSANIAEAPIVLDQGETESLVQVSDLADLDAIGEFYVYTDTTPGSQGIYVDYIARSVTTPAIGLEFAQNGKVLTWSIEDEIDVKEYQIIDAQSGEILAVITAGQTTYSYELDNAVPVKLNVIDNSGFQQSYYPENNNKMVTEYKLNKGWNLISLPGKNAELTELKSATTGEFWVWDGNTYQAATTPEIGAGFWVFAPEASSISISAEKSAKPIILTTGWNLVGPTENCPIPEAGFLVYSWNETYQSIVDDNATLIRGIGYWIFAL